MIQKTIRADAMPYALTVPIATQDRTDPKIK